MATKKSKRGTSAYMSEESIEKLNKMKAKCGMVEGEYLDAAGVKEIASIPSREVLISKFMGSIQSPISSFARVVSQIAEAKAE